MDDQVKTNFRIAAHADGSLIEGCITAFYSELAATWRDGGIMIDGGVHRGHHAKRMSRLENVARVIAVEANRDSCDRLAEHIKTRPKLRKIEIVHAALQGDRALRDIEFHISTNHPGRSGINPVMRGLDDTIYSQAVRVPAATIDGLCKDRERNVRFVKLDLEGGEFGALLGGRQTLSSDQPVCVFENGPMSPGLNGYTYDTLLDYLSSVGLRGSTFFGDVATPANMDGFWYAWAFPVATFDEQAQRLRRIVAAATASVESGVQG